MPMGADLARLKCDWRDSCTFSECRSQEYTHKSTIGQHCLDEARGESGAIEGALVFRHADELVHDRLRLDDVVRPLVVVRVLQLLCLLPEQRLQEITPKTSDQNRTRADSLNCLTFHSVVLMNSSMFISFVSRFEFRSRRKYKSMTRTPTSFPRSCSLQIQRKLVEESKAIGKNMLT